MKRLGFVVVCVLLFSSCGPAAQEEVSIQWYLKQEQTSAPSKITQLKGGSFAGKGQLTKAWEFDLGEKMATAKALQNGFVVSGQKKTIYIDSKSGKAEILDAKLMSGLTDGATVWGDNGLAWSVSQRKQTWKEPIKIAKGDSFAIAAGCLLHITEKTVSRIDQTTGKAIWTLELSTGSTGVWTTTSSYLFIEASGWIFRITPEDGKYVFLAKYSKVKELFSTESKLATLADNKMVIYDEYYSNPLMTMGQSNKTIENIWVSGESMLILTESGYHFGSIPKDMTQQTTQNFKVFTYNASKDKKMMAFSQVIGVDGGNFAIVQGNLVACIGPDLKKDVWYIELPPQEKDEYLPHILSIDHQGVLVFYKNKATLWH